MRISEIMTQPVVAAEPTERLLDAFQLMQQHHIKHLPIVENSQLIGLVSDRDLVGQATRDNGVYVFPRQTVETIMSRPVVTCHPDDSIEDALHKMLSKGISCLIVVADGQIHGIVTSRSFLKQMQVKEIKSS